MSDIFPQNAFLNISVSSAREIFCNIEEEILIMRSLIFLQLLILHSSHNLGDLKLISIACTALYRNGMPFCGVAYELYCVRVHQLRVYLGKS
jgi:hypothetical protein